MVFYSCRCDLEVFGENLYAIHSIRYEELDHHFYVFAIRVLDQWLSWEEVKFYADLLYRIECFEAFAREQHCWGKAYPFASELARFKYFHREGGSPTYEPYDDTWSDAVLMVGLPGMGKDTYIERYFGDPTPGANQLDQNGALDPQSLLALVIYSAIDVSVIFGK